MAAFLLTWFYIFESYTLKSCAKICKY